VKEAMNYMEKDKILILSASYGEGHKQVAKAIQEAVDYALPNAEPIIIDIMQWLHPYLYPLSNFVYKKVIKSFPQVYSYLYQKTREKSTFSDRLNSLFSFGMRSMRAILETIQPKVVVSTYPFAASIISKLKEHGMTDIPAVTIITDFTDHSYWLHPNTDQYLVGSEQVKQRLISLGVMPQKIRSTGIPIRKQFTETPSRVELAAKYDLNPDQFTILIMGGGEGFIGKGVSTIHAFEKLTKQVQLIIVCGRNKKLQKQLAEELAFTKHKVQVMGYCENVNELMAVSDLMISKPGGVTTSEAMAMELPLVIYNPLPGQEEDNANYLVKSGLAVLAENEQDLIWKIQEMTHDSFSLWSMKSKTKIFQTKTSSFDALNVIVGIANGGTAKQIVNA
jgi:processive 1,2-diacylglycerol beta-glucosyltransferase